ncbi:flagellar biosynthesis protein FlhF [Bacillus massiliigorillae]|uniref:flagellar biosynthesis protein FlhF n=1 Tax=Bacillus massiliigorillae TaxID=1243664 RepID=UPI00039FD76C|nr:flagellar biosynthesis protein FlhF [Bacillus massiliigorillae]
MKIKKYHAPSMNQAMEQIRLELGKDAVILNSRVLYSGGFLGFFKKRSIEVVAAIDPQSNIEQLPSLKEKQKKSHISNVTPFKEISPIKINDFGNKEILHHPTQETVLKEITDLKKIVKNINVINNSALLSGNIKKMIDRLKSQDLDHDAVTDIVILLEESAIDNEISYEECIALTKNYLLSKLPIQSDILFQKKYINVVGPTGVGKTTTLAKLAAESVLKHKKKVAFITTDTYRIAAIDQLKTYAKILNVPIEIAYNLEDFKKATERFSHYDLVFIDTAGRNFRNPDYVTDLKDIISFDDEMETFLVLSLASKQSDMEVILEQFSLINISHFIFTKVDETASYGAMYNMMTKYKINAAYLTNGQNVPDDIEKAQSSIIVETILGVRVNERSS